MNNPMADIKTLTEGEAALITVSGEVDASSSIDLDQAIAGSVAGGNKKILVDLSNLAYISSAGLGVFMSYVEEFKEKNIRMVIFGLNNRVAHTFGLLGLADLLEISATKEEAMNRIHGA
jgi:anti-sigma B factor antagonist